MADRQALTVTDPGPLARFEDVKRDPAAPQIIFQRLTEGETLRAIAKVWALPRGRFVQWFMEEHSGLYDAALKVRADELAHDALEVADEQAEVVKKDGSTFDPDVGRDKLRVETRLKVASKWDRARYGEHVRVEKAVTFEVDAGLVGAIGDLLRSRVGRERVVAEVLPAPTVDLI